MLASQKDAPLSARLERGASDPLVGASFSGREHDHYFVGLGPGPQLTDLAPIKGVDFIGDSRSVIAADFDGDGDLDLLVRSLNRPRLRLMRNEGPVGRSVEVRVSGPAAGIGATVRAEIAGRTLIRPILLGTGFLSQEPARILLGLGGSEQIERLVVEFPFGATGELSNVQAGSIVQVEITTGPGFEAGEVGMKVEPRSAATVLGGKDAIMPAPTCDLGWIRKSLDAPSAARLEEALARKPDAPPLVVNLWAPWCEPCREELPALQAWADRHPDTTVVAISVDGSAEAVEAAAQRDAPRLPVGRYRQAAMADRGASLVVPTTCLFSSEGRLVRGWVGPIKVEVLRP